jgi:hypothetical protein
MKLFSVFSIPNPQSTIPNPPPFASFFVYLPGVVHHTRLAMKEEKFALAEPFIPA